MATINNPWSEIILNQPRTPPPGSILIPNEGILNSPMEIHLSKTYNQSINDDILEAVSYGIDIPESLIDKESIPPTKYLVGPSFEICELYAEKMNFSNKPRFLYSLDQIKELPWYIKDISFILIRGKGFDNIEQTIPLEDFIEYRKLILKIDNLRGITRDQSSMIHPECKYDISIESMHRYGQVYAEQYLTHPMWEQGFTNV